MDDGKNWGENETNRIIIAINQTISVEGDMAQFFLGLNSYIREVQRETAILI